VVGLRSLLAEVCGSEPSDRRFLVANFARSALGMEGGGHFSPVVAYSPSADLALVLDVARCGAGRARETRAIY